MQTKTSMPAALAISLAAVVLLFVGCGRNSDQGSLVHFPTKLAHRAVLKPVKAGERIRYVTFDADGVTKLSAQVEYIDGTTAMIAYRTNGTIKDVTVTYPLPKDAADGTKRQVARLIQMAADGRTYASDRQFRLDGTLAHAGTATGPGLYDAFDYQADGKVVFQHQEFALQSDKKWLVVSAETFRQDGSHLTTGARDKDLNMVTTTLDVDGSVLSKATMTKDSTELKTEYYWPGTATLRSKTDQTAFGVTVEQYSEKGVIKERRIFLSNFISMSVTVFNNKGVPVFEQDWLATDMKVKDATDPKTTGRTYRLSQVKELRPDGNAQVAIGLWDDGKTPATRKFFNPGSTNLYTNFTQRSYREDGTLEKVSVEKDYKTV
ncbi:MAG: hypothetical protein ACRD3W_01500, partial [Terriglobales bacterium]